MVAIGSKENFVILAIPSFYLFLNLLVQRKSVFKLLLPVLHILYSIFISIEILLAISKIGHDIYSNDITLVNRISLIKTGIGQTIQAFKIREIKIVMGCFYFIGLRSQGKKVLHLISQSRNSLLLMSFLVFCYLFQILYYSGFWPSNWRYDFPGILSKQLFWITCLLLVSEVATALDNRRITYLVRSIKIFIVIFLIYSSMNNGFQHIINASKGNSWTTNHFTSKIQKLSELSSIYPDYPIVIRSNSVDDHEPVYSIGTFMNYLNIKNRLYFDYIDHDFNSRTGLAKKLTIDLAALSTNGSARVQPITSLKDTVNCISILLNVNDNDKCVMKIKF